MKITGHKTLLAAMLLVTIPSFMHAIPAKKGLLQITQPDGTELTVRLSGDEHSRQYYSEDGFLLVSRNDMLYYGVPDADSRTIVPSPMPARDKSLRTEYDNRLLRSIDKEQVEAIMLESAALRPQKHTPSLKTQGPGLFPGISFPAQGQQKALVILVEYSDVKFNTADPYDYFSRMLNEENFSDYGGTGSARDFFIQNSNGLFQPDFDLYGPVTLSKTQSYYGSNDIYGYDRHPEDMIIEACQALDPTVDFSQYDRDNDGFVDNVFVFYAGRGENAGGGTTTVWPHSADILDTDSTPHIHDGVQLNRYACTNEWNGKRPDGIGTFVHEFSHVLGLPDLYTTTTNYAAFTPDSWSTLDYGPYNNNGCTPPHYSAFERYALGWLEPTEISGPCRITLKDISENEAYIIRTDRDNEYFLFENRQQALWDKYVPGHGMLVWHIDYNATIWERNVVNNNESHQYVDLEEADGVQTEYSRDGDAFPGTAGITSFTDDTTPSMKTWSSKRLGLPVTDITESNGVITFNVAGGHPVPPQVSVLEASDVTPVSFRANWEQTADCDYYLLTVSRQEEDGTLKPLDTCNRLNVGDATTHTVDGLTPETTYVYIVAAVNETGSGAESEPMTVTTGAATFEYLAPETIGGTSSGEREFIAAWKPMDEADGYILNVFTKQRGDAHTTTCDFTGGIAALPQGWTTDAGMTYASASYVGAEPPSLRLNANYIETPVMDDDIRAVSFWYRGASAPAENRLVVTACDSAGKWSTVMESGVDNTAGGQHVTLDRLPEQTRRIRINHERPKSGAVAIDDITLRWGGDFTNLPADGYDGLDVGNVTEFKVTSLPDYGTYYYTVIARKGALHSLPSNETMVIVSDNSGVDMNAAESKTTVTVSGRQITVLADSDTVVSLFDSMGRLAGLTTAVNGHASFRPTTGGIYIVMVNGNASKVVIR